jgi:quercetin dioxygenase-like cupin family protein
MPMDSQHRCFCDLAPLYALDLLSVEDRLWVEAQLALEPALAEELAEYQDAVATTAYGAVAAIPTADLKARLFERIGEPLPEIEKASNLDDSGEPPFWAFQARDLQWKPHPVPGIEIAVMHLDPVSHMAVGMLRVPPNTRYPMHRHAAVEEIYMLQGDLRVDGVIYGPGDYLRSAPGSCHGPASVEGCQFFFRTSIDDEFLEEIPGASVYCW